MMDLKDILLLLYKEEKLDNHLINELWKMAFRSNPPEIDSYSIDRRTSYQKESAIALELLIGISSIDETIIYKQKPNILKLASIYCKDPVNFLFSMQTHTL
jgi:hypothetical protein